MRNIVLALASLVLASCVTTVPAESTKITSTIVHKTTMQPPSPPKLRLPQDVRPLRQTVELTLVPTEEFFGGKTRIDVTIAQSTSVIWLNSDGLTIEKAELIVAEKNIPAKLVTGNENFVGLLFDAPLALGKATISLDYRGPILTKETEGLTRQQEGDDWYIYSDFEPLDARRAFPSFDEPNYKIPWQLTLRTRKQDVALANTPPESAQDAADGFKVTRFAETKPLPSYLVAFAVGPFEIVDAGTAGAKKTPIRIITPKNKRAWAHYAATTTGPILDLLEKYFGTPYPYEKLDLISVPMQGGAMENPGLITFGQARMLSRPEEESAGYRARFANTCAHELAHQWFGDLVTMAWWDDLWLNETFATWMAPKIIEQFEPSWNIVAERAETAGWAMNSDSLVTARRIRQPIESNDDIHNAFDGITYGKGAAVTRMFEMYVGEEKFRKGVQRYLKEHEFGNATGKDFLAAISAEAGKDISAAYSTFLDQPGVPIVNVELTCGATPKLSLAQSRYLPEGADAGKESSLWKIPVCVRYGSGKKTETKCISFETERGELPLSSCPDWVVANDGAAGYYRVGYSNDLLQKLIKKPDVLSTAERISLMANTQALARSGKTDYAQVLELAEKLSDDKNPAVVEAAMSPFGAITRGPYFSEEQRPKFQKFIRDLFGKRALALGFRPGPKDDDPTRQMRAEILRLVADDGGDAKLLAEATKLAKAWLSDRKAIDPDMIQTVLWIAASHGDMSLFEAFLSEAKKATERIDRTRLLQAIGAFRNPAIVEKAFGLPLDPAFNAREAMPALWTATGYPETREQAYVFLKKNYEALAERLPRDYPAEFSWFGAALCDESRRTEVEAYFKERSPKYPGGPRVLAQSLEAMRVCATARRTQLPKIDAFLKARK
ncbi:MAG TPA: M1 family metallopeptidase [Polyangium sp.]|nr:M1 family metallopeptidase [Polyangium sp.]